MTTSPVSLQDLRRRIYVTAKADTTKRFWGLYVHVVKPETLKTAYALVKRNNGAPGIDGVTAQSYAEHLDENLHDLYERLRSGRYQAAPVERVWIEKDDGGQRPIGKPAFEDKIVQRAVAMLLEAIYEQDFYDGA